MAQAPLGRAHQIEHGRITLAHLLERRFGGNAPVHHPDALGFAILFFDPLQKALQRGLIAGVAGHHFVTQRKALRCHNQSNHHLHAIGALVAAVAEFPFVRFGKRRVAFKIGAGQVVEQHVELGVEQIFPTRRQMIEKRGFVFQEQVVTFVKLVALGQLAKIGSQQVAHRALLKPVPVQPPLAARGNQPIRAEGL